MTVTSPHIAMIAAMANNRVIGLDNKMPWHLPADLKHFKALTLGKPVVMGRKTYESIGKALPGRLNIVVTRSQGYTLPDAEVVQNLDQALTLAASENEIEEIMIIGGGAIYQAMLAKATRLYLTHIELDVDGDTYFPDFNANNQWVKVSSTAHKKDEKNKYDYEFVCYEKVAG